MGDQAELVPWRALAEHHHGLSRNIPTALVLGICLPDPGVIQQDGRRL